MATSGSIDGSSERYVSFNNLDTPANSGDPVAFDIVDGENRTVEVIDPKITYKSQISYKERHPVRYYAIITTFVVLAILAVMVGAGILGIHLKIGLPAFAAMIKAKTIALVKSILATQLTVKQTVLFVGLPLAGGAFIITLTLILSVPAIHRHRMQKRRERQEAAAKLQKNLENLRDEDAPKVTKTRGDLQKNVLEIDQVTESGSSDSEGHSEPEDVND